MLYRLAESAPQKAGLAGLAPAIRRNWALHLVVTLPTILTALYLYLFAADQYASEAQYIVRAPQNASAPSLMGDVFGDAGRHARSAVGVYRLPLGFAVEVDAVVEVR